MMFEMNGKKLMVKKASLKGVFSSFERVYTSSGFTRFDLDLNCKYFFSDVWWADTVQGYNNWLNNYQLSCKNGSKFKNLIFPCFETPKIFKINVKEDKKKITQC